jgi:hypothetical protein
VRQENVIHAPEVCLWPFGVIDRTGNEGIVLALERLQRILCFTLDVRWV